MKKAYTIYDKKTGLTEVVISEDEIQSTDDRIVYGTLETEKLDDLILYFEEGVDACEKDWKTDRRLVYNADPERVAHILRIRMRTFRLGLESFKSTEVISYKDLGTFEKSFQCQVSHLRDFRNLN